MEISLRGRRAAIEGVERLLETKIILLKQWLGIAFSDCGTRCNIAKTRFGAAHHDFLRRALTFRIMKNDGFRRRAGRWGGTARASGAWHEHVFAPTSGPQLTAVGLQT
ncbi:hypothetical protein [Burkholderia glumae]|uniref:hypothetical protein n=1 Tax=Burkholderia glumae TaxID=337 RepID=UPI00214A47DF|nr:hypothetical protein [Burkholderia glumae]MCR1766800.1 hypothetical protein [Burkholderia glumae]